MKDYSEVFGYDELKDYIHKRIITKKVAHAILFVGDEGSGKRTIAKRFARTIQCETVEKKLDDNTAVPSDIEPCDKCHSCLQAISGNNPDLVVIDRLEGKRKITIDEIREKLINDVKVKPYACRFKVYIIIGAENLTVEAQNAILKTLEEPPEYVVIILLATTEKLILPTVLSRCEIVNIPPMPDDMVAEYFETHFGKDPDVTPEDIRFAEAFADGKIGRGSITFTNPDFRKLKRDVLEVVLNIEDLTLNEMMGYVRRADYYNELGIDYFFDLMMLWYRDLLLFESTRDVNGLLFKDYLTDISRQAQTLSYEGIDRITDAINKARERLHANVSFETVMELLFLTISESMKG